MCFVRQGGGHRGRMLQLQTVASFLGLGLRVDDQHCGGGRSPKGGTEMNGTHEQSERS